MFFSVSILLNNVDDSSTKQSCHPVLSLSLSLSNLNDKKRNCQSLKDIFCWLVGKTPFLCWIDADINTIFFSLSHSLSARHFVEWKMRWSADKSRSCQQNLHRTFIQSFSLLPSTIFSLSLSLSLSSFYSSFFGLLSSSLKQNTCFPTIELRDLFKPKKPFSFSHSFFPGGRERERKPLRRCSFVVLTLVCLTRQFLSLFTFFSKHFFASLLKPSPVEIVF